MTTIGTFPLCDSHYQYGVSNGGTGTAHLWHILTFAYHQARANGSPADALFRQQQALLRTLPTPSSVVTDTLKLWWAWKKKTDRPFLRSIFLIVLALIFTVATIAASISSSFIVSSGAIIVLVDSPFCGRVNTNPTVGQPYGMIKDDAGANYAADCYQNSSRPSSCEIFTQPNIPLNVKDAPCPFKNKTWCATEAAANVDSGLLDVGTTFGLNIETKDRVRFRQSTTCTVFPIDGHWGIYNAQNFSSLKGLTNVPNERLAIASYGTTFQEAAMVTISVSMTLFNLTTGPGTARYDLTIALLSNHV